MNRRHAIATLGSAATAAAQKMILDTRSYPAMGELIAENPAFQSLFPADAKLEVIASGFDWSEGPVWDRWSEWLLFSDVPANTVYRWREGVGIDVYLKPSGYTGRVSYANMGANGLAFDHKGRLLLCEHGDRRVSVLEHEGGRRTLADNYQGKRFSSPNDLCVKSNGDIYFTDPPYGLPRQGDDARRELDYSGIFLLRSSGEVVLLNKELTRPNGIALSPDERTLYVANSDPKSALWMAYALNTDGTISGAGRILHDVTSMAGRHKGLPDGLKVDRTGNLWASGPGGIHVIRPSGERLGRIETFQASANCCFGGPGFSTLYICADMYLCRIRTSVSGKP
jgi:gluconolactonase